MIEFTPTLPYGVTSKPNNIWIHYEELLAYIVVKPFKDKQFKYISILVGQNNNAAMELGEANIRYGLIRFSKEYMAANLGMHDLARTTQNDHYPLLPHLSESGTTAAIPK